MHRIHTAVLAFIFLTSPLFAANCAPFMGLGTVQAFDNNGAVLTNGVLYSFQAGTSNQQATYTDSTCTTANSNPITFTSGARASVWMNSGANYKFVLCSQNDGSACAPADVLFSVDNVPGNLNGSSSSSGGSTFTGTFISGSSNPASSGAVRLSSGDQLCFRNAANSANLCLSKDANDVVSWASGAFKIPEVACSNTGAGFDYFCADSTAHRWKMANNGGSQFVIPGIGSAGTSGNIVTLAGNGLDIQDSNVGISYLQNVEFTMAGPFSQNGANPACAPSVFTSCMFYSFANAHTLRRFMSNTTTGASGCSQNAVIGVIDLTSSTTMLSQTITSAGVSTTTGGVTIPAGDQIGIGIITPASGCGTAPVIGSMTAVYQ